jgi:hypothetical protein
MKTIIVTEEHKSKLLEMCKVLFPEYGRIEIQEYAIDVDKSLPSPVFVDLYKQHITIPFDIYSIHWFEFCMTHLIRKIDNIYSEKILEPLEKKAIAEGYPENWLEIWNQRPWIKLWSLTNSGNYKKHPVDYLYEEFKKLKK